MSNKSMTNGEIATQGAVGTGASLGAFFISHMSQINGTLQTISLCVGLAIGSVSLVRLLRKR